MQLQNIFHDFIVNIMTALLWCSSDNTTDDTDFFLIVDLCGLKSLMNFYE